MISCASEVFAWQAALGEGRWAFPFGAGTNEVLPVGFQQSLPNQVVVFGIAVLDQCPLHGLFVGVGGDIDLFHSTGVQAGIVHHCGQGGGGGIEVLDLLRIVAHFPNILCQFDGLL